MNSPAVASERSPFSVVMDVIVAPKSAFEALDARPRWLVAFVTVCVLGIAGAVLQIPSAEHLTVATLDAKAAHDPNMATMSPKQLADIKSFSVTIQHFVWAMFPLIAIVGILFASLFLLVGNAIGRGQGNFAKYFALAAHVALINFGISYLLLGVLELLHSPDQFNTQSDVLRVLPSLAWLAPGASPKLTALLEVFNPFTLWSFALLALGLKTIGKVSTPVSWIVAAVIAFGSLLFTVPLAQ